MAPPELHAAEEVFCTGTMGEIVPVIELDSRAIAGGASGAMTRRLRALFQELTRTEGELVVT